MSTDLQSSNPFRRKATAAGAAPAITSSSPAPPDPRANVFDSEPSSNNASAARATADAAGPELPKPKKVVKRVRVQTPPPLSSDSESEGPIGPESPTEDPFESSRGSPVSETLPDSAPQLRNPFSRTLHDIEPGKDQDEANASPRTPGKASLDVAAFSRLLLTGQAGANSAGRLPSEENASTPPPIEPDAESDSTLLPSRHSATDPRYDPIASPAASEAPTRTRKPEAEAAPLIRANEVASSQKKKPPPPSSRHGKAIRLQLGDGKVAHPAPPTPPLARAGSDFNKPLPPAPLRSPEEEEAESVFDREAAGRVPEGSAPPSPAVSGYEVQGAGKRATPAPPPRRNRDSQPPAALTSPSAHGSEPQRRGSMDSTHSRAESIRQPAPAPPPPRRPAHRSTGSITSHPPQLPSPSPHAAPDVAYPTSPRGPSLDPTNPKTAPPPPPTRNASTRRRTSNTSIDSTRRAGKEKEGAPPPPPRRQRGGSRGSVESFTEGRKAGDNGGGVEPLREEDEVSAAGFEAKGDDGQAGVILADLNALQREVEALQKQYASASR